MFEKIQKGTPKEKHPNTYESYVKMLTLTVTEGLTMFLKYLMVSQMRAKVNGGCKVTKCHAPSRTRISNIYIYI